MAKFDLHKTQGINNVMNAIHQVKNVNNIIPLTEAKELLIENIYPSNENFYSVEELDELSESIRELGILQPLLVSERDGGTYEIIAGNRRYEASKMAGLKRIPCIVKQNVEPNLFKIMLIHANMFRVKSDMERATEVAELKKAILALKAADKSLKGRTSEIAGQLLNLSYRQVNRLDNLNKLIPEIQGLVQNERLTASCAEQFANLEESAQKEIYEALVNNGMGINRQEAAKIREEYQAKSREMEAQTVADMESLQGQLLEVQAIMQEKEKELESLSRRLREQEDSMPIAAQDKKELDKVKQALVAALRDRKDIEDRYNELSQMFAERQGGAVFAVTPQPAADAKKLINEVKRKVHLQECIGQLKLASRIYDDYKNLYQSIAPAKPSANEADLINELIRSVQAFSQRIKVE